MNIKSRIENAGVDRPARQRFNVSTVGLMAIRRTCAGALFGLALLGIIIVCSAVK